CARQGRCQIQVPDPHVFLGAAIDLSGSKAQHLQENARISGRPHRTRGSRSGGDPMMLWFGPLDGSGLGLAMLLGLAEGVILAILVSVLAQRYIFRSHQE